METRVGRYLNRLRFPLNGFRAFFLPLLLLAFSLCVCLAAQTANLALPHPIPPPAEDPPPATKKPASTTSPTSAPSVQQQQPVQHPQVQGAHARTDFQSRTQGHRGGA